MTDPFALFTAQQIATATGSPLANVERNWPLVHAALEARGIADRPVQIAALATIAIETASTFEPVREAFWLDDDYRASLRYAPYFGRGYVQLTWESNYAAAGDDLGLDLLTDPDVVLEPRLAASVLAWYFVEHDVPQAARLGDWAAVRRRVQGGTAGLDHLLAIVRDLGGAMPRVTYNRDEPPHPQDETYDCSQDSLEWALYALGRGPSDGWLEETMIREGVMTPDAGLVKASGVDLAAFVVRHYGEYGYLSNNEPSVSWEWAVHEGARNPDGSGHGYPVLLGGRRFGAEGHWVGLRDYDPVRHVLLLANPANGYDNIGQTMTEAQFKARGPWSAVRVWHPDLLEPASDPILPPAPPKLTVDQVRAEIDAMLGLSDERIVGRYFRERLVDLRGRIA